MSAAAERAEIRALLDEDEMAEEKDAFFSWQVVGDAWVAASSSAAERTRMGGNERSRFAIRALSLAKDEGRRVSRQERQRDAPMSWWDAWMQAQGYEGTSSPAATTGRRKRSISLDAQIRLCESFGSDATSLELWQNGAGARLLRHAGAHEGRG